MKERELELYVHIPFCVRKCKYCDFLSAPASKQVQNAYMEALLKEIRERSEGRCLPEYGTSRLRTGGCMEKLVPEDIGVGELPGKLRVTSVFIGGGTPSAVNEEWIECLMKVIGE